MKVSSRLKLSSAAMKQELAGASNGIKIYAAEIKQEERRRVKDKRKEVHKTGSLDPQD